MDIANHIAETRARIDREKRLAWNENQIRTSMNNIASSIRDIHDKKLWEGKFESFEAYCKERWGFSRQRAYQMIGAENNRLMLADAANADEALKSVALHLNDGQAAEFENIPPAKAMEVLKDAVAQPGKMTAAKIKKAKARIIETVPNVTTAANLGPVHAAFVEKLDKSLAPVCPHCGGAL